MRQINDTGFSPDTRYSRAPKKNSINLTNSDLIKLFADYDKVIGVRHSMIRIDEQKRLFYTLDKVLAHKLNGIGVRVRMVTQDPDHIYLFEPQTDTYLTCVPRDLETAGDAANSTPEDRNRLSEFSHDKKDRNKYRRDSVKAVLDGIEAEEEKIIVTELPSSLSEAGRLIISDDEKERATRFLEKEAPKVSIPSPKGDSRDEEMSLSVKDLETAVEPDVERNVNKVEDLELA